MLCRKDARCLVRGASGRRRGVGSQPRHSFPSRLAIVCGAKSVPKPTRPGALPLRVSSQMSHRAARRARRCRAPTDASPSVGAARSTRPRRSDDGRRHNLPTPLLWLWWHRLSMPLLWFWWHRLSSLCPTRGETRTRGETPRLHAGVIYGVDLLSSPILACCTGRRGDTACRPTGEARSRPARQSLPSLALVHPCSSVFVGGGFPRRRCWFWWHRLSSLCLTRGETRMRGGTPRLHGKLLCGCYGEET